MKKLYYLLSCAFGLILFFALVSQAQVIDSFDDGVINSSLWTIGGEKRGWNASVPSDTGSWNYADQEIIDPTDGYLSMHVWGPASSLTYGAEAWLLTKYDFNDGKTHIINFTWEPKFVDTHYNYYFIQVTDGFISSENNVHWPLSEYPGTLNLLRSADGSPGEHFENEQSPGRLNWSISIDPTGIADLYDGPNATGNLKYEGTLYASYPWYLRFMVSDATSMGFHAGDAILNLYDFRTIAFGQIHNIHNIDEFLEKCPTEDPAFSVITKDFKIRRNGVLVTNFSCDGPISKLPISNYTDEIIVLQGLRTIYYMDRNLTNYLPWTSGSLYDWMKSKIGGINISDTSGFSYCCVSFDYETYIGVAAQNDFNRDFDRTWRGIAGNIALYAHEVRHVDGYPHVSCCDAGGCDQAYDEADLSPYGIQWWLNWAWLTGKINVGIGCLDSSRVQTIASWHLSSCNTTFANRFCDNRPPEINMPDRPGGVCIDNVKGMPWIPLLLGD